MKKQYKSYWQLDPWDDGYCELKLYWNQEKATNSKNEVRKTLETNNTKENSEILRK